MVHIKQPEGSSLCGHSVVAMAAGVSLDRAIEVIGHTKATTTKEVRNALRSLGIQCADRLRVVKKNMPVYPPRCIVAIKHSKKQRFHWVLMWDGALLDPDPIGNYDGWKATSYLEILS